METTVKIYNVNLLVIGNYECPDEEVGYRGGFTIDKIMLEDTNIYDLVSEHVLNLIYNELDQQWR